jgi:hypothetical protein
MNYALLYHIHVSLHSLLVEQLLQALAIEVKSLVVSSALLFSKYI